MALDFDGTNDFVDHGDIAAMDGAANLTAMAYVWMDNLAVDDGFWGKGSGGTEWHFGTFNADSSIVVFRYNASFAGRTGAGVLTTGAWIHWAMVFAGGGATDADKLKIYKNAVAEALTYDASPPATLPDTGASTYRTMTSEQSGTFADGKMAFHRVWTAALSLAEIVQEMQSYRPVRTSGLILGSHYDDGTSARDYSGAGNHGTVTGATQIAGPPLGYGAAA